MIGFTRLRAVLLAGMVGACGMSAGAPAALAYDDRWVDQVAQYILVEKEMNRDGSFDPYLDQVREVRGAAGKGDWVGTYRGMNQLMALLETGAGGISKQTADRIWAYCYEVVPHDLHSEDVHVKAVGKAQYERMKEREEREREISSNSF